MSRLLVIFLLSVTGFAASPTPLKQSLVQLRKDLASWGRTIAPRLGEARSDGRSLWYSMPMSSERKALDKEYGSKFDVRITAAVKALNSAGFKDEAEIVDWFHNESVAPKITFKHWLDEMQKEMEDIE